MELTWQDVKCIVELYEHFNKEADREIFEWSMDEDQIGIAYPYPKTEEDICKQTLEAFKNGKV